jgi:nitrite reductase/ring-hydroxylating ferredoxin subunit
MEKKHNWVYERAKGKEKGGRLTPAHTTHLACRVQRSLISLRTGTMVAPSPVAWQAAFS